MHVKRNLLVNMRDDIANGAGKEVESLWLELQRNKANTTLPVGVCFKPLNIKEEKENCLLLQLETLGNRVVL